MPDMTALPDLNRLKNIEPAVTPEKRKANMIALHSVGEMAYWVLAERLVESDLAMDWAEAGYKSQWEWWQDFVEGNGFPRPSESEYASFQMQIRCGRFAARCRALEIDPDVLLSIGRSKADLLARGLADADKPKIEAALSRATELSRTDVARMLSGTKNTNGRAHDANAGDLKHDLPEPSQDTPGAPMFDAEQEPPGPAPILADDRPVSEHRYYCACGRVHVVWGNVDEHRIEGL